MVLQICTSLAGYIIRRFVSSATSLDMADHFMCFPKGVIPILFFPLTLLIALGNASAIRSGAATHTLLIDRLHQMFLLLVK